MDCGEQATTIIPSFSCVRQLRVSPYIHTYKYIYEYYWHNQQWMTFLAYSIYTDYVRLRQLHLICWKVKEQLSEDSRWNKPWVLNPLIESD